MTIAIATLVVLCVIVGTGLVIGPRRRVRGPSGELELVTATDGSGPEVKVPGTEIEPSSPTTFLLDDGAGGELYAEVIDRDDAVLWARADAGLSDAVTSVAIDKALETLPYIGAALEGGKWVRILNPEALELGDQIRSRSGGFLGGIMGDNKKFAAQLRFSSPQDLAKLATPAAVFKAASAVTGQYYLNRINSQLMTIEREVRQLSQDLRNETYASIYTAGEDCIELEEALSLSLDLTADERARLLDAERDIDKAYAQKVKDVEDFLEDVERTLAETRVDPKDVESLLRAAEGKRLYDMQLMAYAAAVRHKLNVLRAQVDRGAADGRGDRARRKLDAELQQMRHDLAKAAAALERLAVTRNEAREAWTMKRLRRPPKALDGFSGTGRKMAGHLADAPDTILLEPAPAPMMIEAYVSDSGVLTLLSATPETHPPELAVVGDVERKEARLRVLRSRDVSGEAAKVRQRQVDELEDEVRALRESAEGN